MVYYENKVEKNVKKVKSQKIFLAIFIMFLSLDLTKDLNYLI